MKKTAGLLIIGILAAAGYVFITTGRPVSRTSPTETPAVKETAVVAVTITGIGNPITVADVRAPNAYNALVAAVKKRNLEIKTKSYDFGIFVESIGGYPNTKEKAWIYYVNGKSGAVAADKQALKNGDTIEWKYEKPIY